MTRSLRILFTTFIFLCLFSADILASPSVIFDESHGQQFLINESRPLDLSDLAGTIRSIGFEVTAQSEKLTEAVLSSADVLVISGAFNPLEFDEIEAVLNFVKRGGGLAVLLHIAPPVGTLLHRLDVDFTNGTLRETSQLVDDNPLNFRVSHLERHPVTDGLGKFSLYGAWALRPSAPHVRIVAQTSEHGWVDLDRNNQLSANDAVQQFGVMAAGELGRGRYLVIGDDALFQNRFFDQDNRELAIRIVEWLSFR